MQIVFLNGKFLKAEQAKVSTLDAGFLYGFGLFETMRSYHCHIVYLDLHLERIRNSCKLMDMKFPYPLNKLKAGIERTVEINNFPDAYVRLSLWKAQRGTDTLILVKKYRPYPAHKYKNGFRACVSRFRQNEDSFLARLKTSNYLLYRLAYLEAKNKGFDEAIILNSRGYIAETSRANIFLVKDKALFTPSLECGCLDGITRRLILNLAKKYRIPVNEGNFTLSDLFNADEVFFTNSLMGIMPLASLERKRLKQRPGQYRLTGFFGKKYKSLLSGK